MLPRVASSARSPLALTAVVAVGACVALRCAPHAPEPTLVLVEPPSLPSPPPLRSIAREAPVVGCPDVATVGTPATALQSGEALWGAEVASDGCTLAAWTSRTLYVSWDGGATFTGLAVTFDRVRPLVTAHRLVLVDAKARRVGVMHRGDAAPTWRLFPDLAPTEDMVGGSAASDRWIAVGTDARIAISDDEAQTWHYIAPPPASAVSTGVLTEITDDGALTAIAYDNDLDGPGTPHPLRANITDGEWREPGPAPGWSYTLDLDDYWGCGGTSKLVAHHGRKVTTLAGHLSDVDGPIGLAVGTRAAYALLPGFVRLRGTTMTELPLDEAVQGARLVGVDQDGTAILTQYSRLLRWSPLGGWRELMNASPE